MGLRPGSGAAGRVLDGGELEELARAQFSRLVNTALHDQAGGVKGPDGALVVKGEGGVKRGAIHEQVELRLAGGAGSIAGESIDDLLQDQAVMGHERLSDHAWRGG